MEPLLRRPGTVIQAKLCLLPGGLTIATFDAYPFLCQATDETLRELFLSNWRSYSHNDEIVKFTLEHQTSPHLRSAIAVMVLATKGGERRDWFVELTSDAVSWMIGNKPGLWQTLLDETGNNDPKTTTE